MLSFVPNSMKKVIRTANRDPTENIRREMSHVLEIDAIYADQLIFKLSRRKLISLQKTSGRKCTVINVENWAISKVFAEKNLGRQTQKRNNNSYNSVN